MSLDSLFDTQKTPSFRVFASKRDTLKLHGGSQLYDHCLVSRIKKADATSINPLSKQLLLAFDRIITVYVLSMKLDSAKH